MQVKEEIYHFLEIKTQRTTSSAPFFIIFLKLIQHPLSVGDKVICLIE